MEVADINEENKTSSSSRRNQKRHSLSSILKASPSRQALSDLDGNRREDTDVLFPDTKQEKRKKRRSSKRVSFANTHEVKEFLKEKDARDLGIFETSTDGSNHKEDDKSAPSTGLQGQPSTTNPPDGVSVGPGHSITGLDTLLTAPIVQPSQSTDETQGDADAERRCATINKFLQDLRDQEEAPPVADKTPFFDFTSGPTKEEDTEGAMSQFLKTLTFFNDPREELEEGHTMTKIVSLFGDDEGCLEREDEQRGVTSDENTFRSGNQELTGDQPEKTIFFQADVDGQSGNMEMTSCYDHTIHQPQVNGTGTSTGEPIQQMKQQYCDTLGLLGPTYTCKIPSCDSSESISLHSSCLHNSTSFRNLSLSSKENGSESHLEPNACDDKTRVFTQEDASANMEMTTCLPQSVGVISGDSSKGQKEGIKIPMTDKDMDNTPHSQNSNSSTMPDRECTQIFGQSDKTSNMELTACISLMGKNSALVANQSYRLSGLSSQPSSEPGFEEKTKLYGQDDVTVGMDFTEPIPTGSSVERADYPSSDEKSRISTKESAVKANQSNRLSGISFQTSGELMCEEKTQVYGQDDKTGGMDFTEPIPAGSHDGRTNNHTFGGERTRIFAKDSALGDMDITLCGSMDKPHMVSNRLSLSKPMDAEDKTVVFGVNEPYGDVDLTECLETLTKQNTGKKSEDSHQSFEKREKPLGMSGNITSSHEVMTDNPALVPSDHTKIYHREDGEMEMTECVDAKVLKDIRNEEKTTLKPLQSLPQVTERKEKTILFKEEDINAGMDLTECLEGAQLEGMDETGESRGRDPGPEGTSRRSDGQPPSMQAQLPVDQFSEQDKENVPVPLSEPTENITLGDINLSKIKEGPLDSTHIFPNDHLGRRSAFFPSSALKQKHDVSMDISVTGDTSYCPIDPSQKTPGTSKAIIDSSKKSNEALLSIKSRIARLDQSRRSKAKTGLFQTDPSGSSQSSSHSEGAQQDVIMNSDKGKASQDSSKVKTEFKEERKSRLLEPIDELPSMLLNTTSSAKYSWATLNDDLLNSTNETPAETRNRSLKRPHSKSLLPQDALEGPIKVKRNQEDGKMEVSASVADKKVETTTERESSHPNSDDNVTRRFGPDDGEGMELTSCIEKCIQLKTDKENVIPIEYGSNQSFPPGKVSKLAPDIDGDHTRRFLTDDTGKMELTSCLTSNVQVGIDKENMPLVSQTGFAPDVPGANKCSSSFKRTASLDDQTRRFESENTGKMELTMCTRGKIEMLSEHMAGPEISQVSREGLIRGTDEATEDDKTRRFEFENTGQMELTMCTRGKIEMLSEQMAGPETSQAPREGLIQGTDEATEDDKTRRFESENTGKMELTMCTRGKIEMLSGHMTEPETSQAPREGLIRGTDEATGDDKTRRFELEAGKMELTACLTGKIEGAQNNEMMQSAMSRLQLDDGKMSQTLGTNEDDHTKRFKEGDTGGMELTACVEASVNPDFNQKSSFEGQVIGNDVTKMFVSEETGKMELTKCLTTNIEGMGDKISEGGQDTAKEWLESDMEASSYKSHASMKEVDSDLPERTQVFQDGLTDMMELTNVHFKGQSDGPPPCKKAKPTLNPADERTKVFNSENTGNMEMTTCMTGNIQAMDSSQQLVGNCEKETCDDVSVHQKESVSEGRAETHVVEEMVPCDKTDQNSLQEKPVTDDVKADDGSKVKESESKGSLDSSGSFKKRDSETFTLEKSQFDLPDVTDQVKEAEGGSPGAPKEDAPVPSTSVAGQPNLSVTDSRLLMPEWPLDLSADGIMDETEFQSPECTEDLEGLVLGKMSFRDTTATGLNLSTMPGSLPPASEEVKDLNKATSPSTDDKLASKDIVEDISESLTVGKYFNLFQSSSDAADDANLERETLVSVDLKKPEDLEDFLKVLFVTKPDQEIHDWAITELQSKLTKLRGALQSQTSQLLKDKYPNIFIKLKEESTRQKTYSDLLRLHNFCMKFSRNQFYEWDLKMKSRLREEMKYGIEKLNPKVDKLSEGLERLDAKLKLLGQVSVDLDEAVSNFQEIHLPKKEEEDEFISNREKLLQLEAENVTTNENIQQLEKEKLSLIGRKNELQREQENLDEKMLGVSSRDTEEEENTKNKELMELTQKLTTLHSLQEWVLEGMSPVGDKLRFTFFNSSLDLTVEYECSKGLPTTVKELTIQSSLPEDGCPVAKLIHRLILEALKVEELKTTHPSYSSLPVLLQQISMIVIRGRQLEMEIRHINYWHMMEIQDCSLQVEFSSLQAHAKFLVTFNLNLDGYPNGDISTITLTEIGKIKEEDIQGVMKTVKSGAKQLTRLVQCLDHLLQAPVSPDPLG